MLGDNRRGAGDGPTSAGGAPTFSTHPNELAVFARLPVQPVRGRGCWLEDAAGRRYLDMYGGHAVALAGHCHPRVVAAIREQADALLFYSNVVPLEVRARLFTVLAELAPAELPTAFLVNSGAEANEAALMLARRVTGRPGVVSVEGGFHGRSLATLAVSGLAHYRELAVSGGAGAALLGLSRLCPFGDAAALDELVGADTAAVIVEPVQGMAGARDCAPEFLAALRAACDRAGAMLIFDEVQCGCGRTGAFTAAQAYGVTPDLLTLAKGIAGGLPMGAVLMTGAIAATVGRGDMGTTFGGGPVPCAAAAANLAVLRDDGLPANAARMEGLLRAGLAALPGVRRVQGRGLLLGAALDRSARDVAQALFERGVLSGTSEDPTVLRLLPPLTLGEAEVEVFVKTIGEVL
ncbi:MAG: aspartate aminotransferase family protein [Acidobacteriota bacterium]